MRFWTVTAMIEYENIAMVVVAESMEEALENATLYCKKFYTDAIVDMWISELREIEGVIYSYYT